MEQNIHNVFEIKDNKSILIYSGTLEQCLKYFRKHLWKKMIVKKAITSGSERRDLQIQQITTTQKTIPNKKKNHKPKHKDEKTFFE